MIPAERGWTFGFWFDGLPTSRSDAFVVMSWRTEP